MYEEKMKRERKGPVPHFHRDVSLFNWRTMRSNQRAAFGSSLMVGEEV
jgi:hypothetical protein